MLYYTSHVAASRVWLALQMGSSRPEADLELSRVEEACEMISSNEWGYAVDSKREW